MKRNIKSIMAFALAATLAASTLAPATTAQAASKQNVITKATDNSGYTYKYSYNKKGLVTKCVATTSSKGNNSDSSTTITTTYKYNKKNKIATKTEKEVAKTTTYETDKTTSLKLGAKKGTVTKTTTAVTKFTYNKKGLATQSVTTKTTGMSGSITESKKKNNYARKELNGLFIAGWNRENADGTENEEQTSANTYYYESIAPSDEDYTETTTYTDNGNGTYTTVKATKSTSNGTAKYEYGKAYKKTDSGIVEMTQVLDDKGLPTGKYKKPDGTETYDYDYVVYEKATVVPSDSDSSTVTLITDTDTTTDKTVTTTKYSYDKKKRVKKAVATTVNNSSSAMTKTTSYDSKNKSYTKKVDKEYKADTTSETKSVETTTYAYDKKGRAKKVVSSSDGKEDSKTVVKGSMDSNDPDNQYDPNAQKLSYAEVYYKEDGTVSSQNSESKSYDTYKSTLETTVSNGVSTVSTTLNPYTETYSSNYEYGDGDKSTGSGTKAYTYYGNGGKKTVNTYTGSYSYKNYEGKLVTTSSTGTKTEYEFDKKGDVTGTVEMAKYTDGEGKTSDNNNAQYKDIVNKETIDDDLAAQAKIDAAKATLEASGAVYVKTKSRSVLAAPYKEVYTYKYDKSGNVKTEKVSRTWTEVEIAKNETYGNDIYEADANGMIWPKQVAVTHKSTGNYSRENTVKKGTKRLTKKINVSKYYEDRAKGSGYGLSRVLYKLKAKKGNSAVEKQQWIIQNGALNGVVGLD